MSARADGFDFKQFSVRHDRCAMKVGTDGVLLGAAAPLPAGCRVLDVGAGSGLLCLMAAQRGAASVVGVEIDAAAAEQARENAAASPWADRIEIVCADIAHFQAAPFDVLLSNPPFFDRALRAPEQRRTLARHADTLGFPLLARATARLLAPCGTASIIIPVDREADLLGAMAAEGLFAASLLRIQTKEQRPPKRAILTFDRRNCKTEMANLTLFDSNGQKTEPYNALTRDFYL